MTDLQVVYKKQENKFIKPLSFFTKSYGIKKKDEEFEEEENQEEEENEDDKMKKSNKSGSFLEQNENDDEDDAVDPKTNEVDILGLDLTGDVTGTGKKPPQNETENKSISKLSLDNLEADEFEYDDNDFQTKWAEMEFE